MEGVIGFTTLFAGNFAPRNWALCQGQIIAIASNTALFSILGTTYGGNGQTTFGLPDLRGRCVIGAGNGPGLSPYDLGEVGGVPTTTMLSTQMPAHNHTVAMHITPGAAGSADTTNPVGGVYATPSSGDLLFGPAPSGETMTYPGSITTGITGNNVPFPIQDPVLGLNYIVCMRGIFPARN